jgi:hypothetical protein
MHLDLLDLLFVSLIWIITATKLRKMFYFPTVLYTQGIQGPSPKMTPPINKKFLIKYTETQAHIHYTTHKTHSITPILYTQNHT